MTARKPFLLRTDPAVLAALNRWAADELRSVNGQIDYILRRALTQAHRFPARASAQTDGSADDGAPSEQG